MSESIDQMIQADRQRWAQEDTTAAIKNLQHQLIQQQQQTPIVQTPAVIYIEDSILWNLNPPPPPETDWVPTVLASLVLVIVIVIVWKNIK